MRAADAGLDRGATGPQEQDPAPDHHGAIEQDEQGHDQKGDRVDLEHRPERGAAVHLAQQVREDEAGQARSHPERAEPTRHARGLRATNVSVSNRFLRTLNSRSSVPVQRDSVFSPGTLVNTRRRGERIAPQPGGHADAAHHALDLEAAVVEQLLHAALGGDEVVGVVHVPEEGPLLQVVGDDDEEHAAGAQQRAALRP